LARFVNGMCPAGASFAPLPTVSSIPARTAAAVTPSCRSALAPTLVGMLNNPIRMCSVPM
jgi:hypothetical protein